MNKSLRESRIDAIKIIYSVGVSKESVSTVASNLLDDCDEVALKLAMNVCKNIEEIDRVISDSLTNYTITRLNQVDRAIIELATYELLEGTEPALVINEALEITKIYSDQGDKKAVAFNNKLLDSIKNNIKK